MKNKSILLKSVICGSVYFVLSLSIILTVYVMDLNLYSATVLGSFCGIIVAVITICDTRNKTVITRLFGIISVVIAQLILSISGIPYFFIMQIYKDDEWFREIGHLTVNEVIGYNWGLMFFWYSLLISFAISIISIFIFHVIKNRRHEV